MESSIAMAELELTELVDELNTIFEELHEMQKGGGMSFWLKPILHPDRPLCDAPNMIIMKPCGVCGQSYHCFDIVVTSFLHMYQPSCLDQHLKTHNKCKVSQP